jgi:hypothetical protein
MDLQMKKNVWQFITQKNRQKFGIFSIEKNIQTYIKFKNVK